MSLIIGAIWWDVPGSDSQLLFNDRPGFHYTMAVLAPWPILLLTLGEVGRERWSIHRDIRDRLYYRIVYIFMKVCCKLVIKLWIDTYVKKEVNNYPAQKEVMLE